MNRPVPSNKKILKSAVICAAVLSLTANTISGAGITALPDFLCERPLPVFREHENSEMKIALTFDDGPHPEYTREILTILDEYGIEATFFMIGENVGYYPDVARQVIEAGHEIGNHTYTHPRLKQFTDASLEHEILSTEAALYELGECRPHLFRPPEGVCSKRVSDIADKYDYTVVLWTVDTLDWAHTPSEKIAENVITNIRPGGIILCHDYIAKDTPTPEALRIFIPKLLEAGYKFVTVSELMVS